MPQFSPQPWALGFLKVNSCRGTFKKCKNLIGKTSCSGLDSSTHVSVYRLSLCRHSGLLHNTCQKATCLQPPVLGFFCCALFPPTRVCWFPRGFSASSSVIRTLATAEYFMAL